MVSLVCHRIDNPPSPLAESIADHPGLQLPGQTVFYIPDTSPTGAPSFYSLLNAFPPPPDYYAYGSLQLTLVTTPEPGSGLLMLIGLGLLGLVMRKR